MPLNCRVLMERHYHIQEIFYSLVGEGAQAGRSAVFIRFAGCNLWSGLEEHRAESACNFCDTDFVSGKGPLAGEYGLEELIGHVVEAWEGQVKGKALKYVVLTGGEPALQVDAMLIHALKRLDFEIAIETNGTRPLPDGLDWVCVSPKGREGLKCDSGDELKFVFPQEEVDPDIFRHMDFKHFYIQPKDTPENDNWDAAKDYCLRHPEWKLSMQLHKVLGLK